jgi:hypothetical protein
VASSLSTFVEVATVLPELGEMIVEDRQGDIAEQRRENATLGSACNRVPHDTVLGEDTGFEERFDQVHDTFVPDPCPHPGD